jgi:hypothetical protein
MVAHQSKMWQIDGGFLVQQFIGTWNVSDGYIIAVFLHLEWNDFTKNIQEDIFVLHMPLLDTTQYDRLEPFIEDFFLQFYLGWQKRNAIEFEDCIVKDIGVAYQKGIVLADHSYR